MPANPKFDDVAPWPQHQRAEIGHNRPPLDAEAAAAFDEKLAETAGFLSKLEQLIEAADRAAVTDDVTLGHAGDLVASYRKADRYVSETHKAVKEPYLAAGRAVDAKKNEITARIQVARRKVDAVANRFLNERAARERAERERIAAEQRRQAEEAASAQALRDEAAATNDAEAMEHVPVIAAPAAMPARAEPVRSDAGTTVSGRTITKAEVTDYTAAFAAVQSNPKVREAIDKAVQALARAGQRDIPGARVWEEQAMAARG